jgi:hypothetical protein
MLRILGHPDPEGIERGDQVGRDRKGDGLDGKASLLGWRSGESAKKGFVDIHLETGIGDGLFLGQVGIPEGYRPLFHHLTGRDSEEGRSVHAASGKIDPMLPPEFREGE